MSQRQPGSTASTTGSQTWAIRFSGCEMDTGTHEVLGVVKIPSVNASGSLGAVMSSSQYAFALRADYAALVALNQKNKAQIPNLSDEDPDGNTEIVRGWVSSYTEMLGEVRADMPPAGVDPDLVGLWHTLVDYAANQVEGLAALAREVELGTTDEDDAVLRQTGELAEAADRRICSEMDRLSLRYPAFR